MEIILMDTDFVYEYFSKNADAVKVVNEKSRQPFYYRIYYCCRTY